jgi:anti-sigma B factor antagonist
MTARKREVTVVKLPEKLSARKGRAFFREVQRCMQLDRPCLVLDCSGVRQMDTPVAHLLLCCLEEAMKRNGNVKLAAVPPRTEAVLDLSGISRLFEMFDTTAEAENSFHQFPFEDVSHHVHLAARMARRKRTATV